jgi:hypothetical protein
MLTIIPGWRVLPPHGWTGTAHRRLIRDWRTLRWLTWAKAHQG